MILNEKEKHALKTGRVSRNMFEWFRGFYKERLCHKPQQRIEKKREDAANDDNLHEHFFGPNGLEATLIKHGIMDPITKVVPKGEMRRVLNFDELCNFVDFNSGKGNAKLKFLAGAGESVQSGETENRQSMTVEVMIGWDGFQYGIHILDKAKQPGEQHLGRDPDARAFWDGGIDDVNQIARVMKVGCVDGGVQTHTTLLESMKTLDELLTRRGVTRPVVLMADNHGSRFGVEGDRTVMEYMDANGIDLFLEPPCTSGWLQALDQIFRGFHTRYDKERKALKVERATVINSARWREHEAAGGDLRSFEPTSHKSVTLSTTDFMTIMSRMCANWSTPTQRRLSFHRVGLGLDGAICPWVIDRSAFVQIQSSGSESQGAEGDLPRPTAREGTQEFFEQKADIAEARVAELEAAAMGTQPSKFPGLMAPTKHVKSESRRRKNLASAAGNSGSVSLSGLSKQFADRDEEVARRRKELKRKAEELEQKKLRQAWARYHDHEAWLACQQSCVCDKSPCPQAQLHYCGHCKTVKRARCRVQACQAKVEAKAQGGVPPKPKVVVAPPPPPQLGRGHRHKKPKTHE